MTKKEIIWRHILSETLTKRINTFTQKKIASTFHFSTSTVFNALKAPRKMGAVAVTGRYFRLLDAEKLLLLWATHRDLKKDILYATAVDMPAREIEGNMPPDAIFAAFSAYRLKYNDAPADYTEVYVYSQNIDEIKKRFPKTKGAPNLFVLKPDPFLSGFGPTTPDIQTFADLWNLPQWYARDYLTALKKRLNFA
jgi:hypothetical protein